MFNGTLLYQLLLKTDSTVSAFWGYRADPNQIGRWIKIDLEKEMIITAIATQGYGDVAIEEWIKQYVFMYSNGRDYSYFKDLNGELKVGEMPKS